MHKTNTPAVLRSLELSWLASIKPILNAFPFVVDFAEFHDVHFFRSTETKMGFGVLQ